MPTPSLASDAYLEAFMNGFEFVLLAIQGRLAEVDLPSDERARMEAFLADYWRISQAYHDRHPAPSMPTVLAASPSEPTPVAGAMLSIAGPFRTALSGAVAN